MTILISPSPAVSGDACLAARRPGEDIKRQAAAEPGRKPTVVDEVVRTTETTTEAHGAGKKAFSDANGAEANRPHPTQSGWHAMHGRYACGSCGVPCVDEESVGGSRWSTLPSRMLCAGCAAHFQRELLTLDSFALAVGRAVPWNSPERVAWLALGRRARIASADIARLREGQTQSPWLAPLRTQKVTQICPFCADNADAKAARERGEIVRFALCSACHHAITSAQTAGAA